ncbi:MAG: MlaD family protein [Zoogloeaceae bacterium]|jgi:phospholipid/cholesterol/gamma-HCH transport system substrate-binding protein|nr:MlaD family protein [Zoogloeaceae bacterium]
MENRAHALLAGLFTLVLGTAVFLSLFWFGAANQEETRELLVVSRQNVNGLNPQARVSYRGIQVGKVEDIYLDPEDMRNILIRIQIKKNLPLGMDTSAHFSYQGITGIAQILLEDGHGPDNDWESLPEEIAGKPPRIPLEASLMNQIQEKLPEMLVQVQNFLSNANALLNENNRHNLGQILAHLESASKRTDDTLSRLQQALSPENIQSASSAMREIPALVKEARLMVQHIDDVTTRLDDIIGVQGEPGERLVPQVAAMSQELTVTTRQLGRVLEMLERSPQSLIFGAAPARPGPGEAGFSAPGRPSERP